MTIRQLPTAIAFVLLSAGSALAVDQEELQRRGYAPAWQGDAVVQTCRHGIDTYRFGRFVFSCDQFNHDYPYHYGEITLLSQPGQALGYLCIEEGEDCLMGTIVAE